MKESNTVWQAKAALREYATARRKFASRSTRLASGGRAADHFLANIPVAPGSVISGYFPVNDEFDVMPLLRRLIIAGYRCVLPCVEKDPKHLVFRNWAPGDTLVEGPLKIPEPSRLATEYIPTIVLAPLLAYDSRGFRLGYGGGYYDMALSRLRSSGAFVLAVGVAFSDQMVESVPHSNRDERLNWIITERGAIAFNVDKMGNII